MNEEESKYPPRCQGCGRKLTPRPSGCTPCPICPPGTRVVYYMQKNEEGYPAGYPLCTWCGKPVAIGRAFTCDDFGCRVKEKESRMR